MLHAFCKNARVETNARDMNSDMSHGGTDGATDPVLLQALKEALDREDPSSPDLRDAVFNFVQRLRGRAQAPQHVVIALKAHLQSANHHGAKIENELADRVIRWGIDAYYG